ncbi:sulfurtransferase complex subunit TusC [uncultured Pseudoteredinibacter sp.]|uniref:sulfurtransferase complex subunit TusC n=1 Tax=uncultured Pseudoteredinibacter sp. TaxID=1641701 RepID=UPI00262D2031|nr:sulfurtransferase complex subunit TusC [uncultured Pseudoteredinibacter sp.]
MSEVQKKNITFICRHSPYGGSQARELLDAALAGAAFDQNISLLFMGAGILQLVEEQNPSAIEQKNLAKMLSMLALYDVENVFVHEQALEQFGIEEKQLLDVALLKNSLSIQEWLQEQDICMSL